MSTIEKMISEDDDLTEKGKDFMRSYKRKDGKSLRELEEELNKAEGLDEEGNPNWYEAQSALIDAYILAKIFALGDEFQ
jgi:hypothetical protein